MVLGAFMAKSEDDLFDNHDEDEMLEDQSQLKGKNTKYNHEVRTKVDEYIEQKKLGLEDSDDDYLDHYYDFDE